MGIEMLNGLPAAHQKTNVSKYQYIEYPKSLYKKAKAGSFDERVVRTVEEEKAAVSEGFMHLNDHAKGNEPGKDKGKIK